MKFRVYEFGTDKDVTDEEDWYIDTEGDLFFLDGDTGSPWFAQTARYYYKLEIEVM